MDELKLVTASNIINLRTAMGMTQVELGEKLNYSDKSISKWERGEAVPDVYVLSNMAAIFGVTVDYLIKPHDQWDDGKKRKPEVDVHYSGRVVTLVSIVGIWTLAVLLFVICWMLGTYPWIIFVTAVPASLITLLVFNSVWRKGKNNYWIIAALILSVFVLVYLFLLPYNPWQVFLVLAPAELIVFLCSKIKKKKR